MKVFCAGILTETNTFATIPTALEDFVITGRTGAEACEGAGVDLSKIWGVQARARGDELICSIMAFAQPSGITTRSAYEILRGEILADLRRAGSVDVVLLVMHGSMSADGYDDCEADLIGAVRATDDRLVIGAVLDLHCNLTEGRISNADIVLTYKHYPHVDVNERAHELYELAVSVKEGRFRPTSALFDCRMVGLFPTTREPLKGIVESMKLAERRPGVLSVSFAHGFQFADRAVVGATVLVVTDDNPSLAKQVAREFGCLIYSQRRDIDFCSISLPMDAALSLATAAGEWPVVVADQSDNPGGGAPGDATYALEWLLQHGLGDAGLALFYDPEVVRLAIKAGIGSRLKVRLGGKVGRTSGSPLDLEVEVLALRYDYMHVFLMADGEPDPTPVGDTVALRCGSVDIIVASSRCQCFSPDIFTDFGIDPRAKRLLIVKSTQHFFSGFAPIASKIIYMAGPGAVAPDPRLLDYTILDKSSRYPWISDPLGEVTLENCIDNRLTSIPNST